MSIDHSTWVRFTKRTDDPKLAYLEWLLDEQGISSRRNGWSFHAPILEVHEEDLDCAWAILGPIDDVPDDDPAFAEGIHLRDRARERRA